jgi:soluble lytic murein transglycosylase-like protein
MKKEYLMDIVKSECKFLGFNDVELIYAIIETESGWNPYTVRYEPAWKYIVSIPDKKLKSLGITRITEEQLQKFSWGLMQIMGSVARELNFTGILTELVNPQLNVNLGIRHIKNFIGKYKKLEDVIASYNAGSPRKREDGKYVNQDYVDKVLTNYNKYKEANK